LAEPQQRLCAPQRRNYYCADDKGFKLFLGLKMRSAWPLARRVVGGFHGLGFGRTAAWADWPGRGCVRTLNLTCSAAGRHSHGILEEAEVIILEPDLAKLVGSFHGQLLGIHKTWAQRANHILNVSRLSLTRRCSCAVFQIFSAEICMLHHHFPTFLRFIHPAPPSVLFR